MDTGDPVGPFEFSSMLEVSKMTGKTYMVGIDFKNTRTQVDCGSRHI